MLSKNYDADVDRVLSNLKKGSENHMRAFIRQLTKYNETYTPQYISQEYFESII
jgi:predicted SPOUT superfamily RNA methylase MTH1